MWTGGIYLIIKIRTLVCTNTQANILVVQILSTVFRRSLWGNEDLLSLQLCLHFPLLLYSALISIWRITSSSLCAALGYCQSRRSALVKLHGKPQWTKWSSPPDWGAEWSCRGRENQLEESHSNCDTHMTDLCFPHLQLWNFPDFCFFWAYFLSCSFSSVG